MGVHPTYSLLLSVFGARRSCKTRSALPVTPKVDKVDEYEGPDDGGECRHCPKRRQSTAAERLPRMVAAGSSI